MRKAIDSIWIITNSEWNSVLAAMTHVDDSYIANWLMISITIDVDAGQPSWFWSMELQNAQKTQKCSTTTLQWWSPSSGLFEGAFFSQPETFLRLSVASSATAASSRWSYVSRVVYCHREIQSHIIWHFQTWLIWRYFVFCFSLLFFAGSSWCFHNFCYFFFFCSQSLFHFSMWTGRGAFFSLCISAPAHIIKWMCICFVFYCGALGFVCFDYQLGTCHFTLPHECNDREPAAYRKHNICVCLQKCLSGDVRICLCMLRFVCDFQPLHGLIRSVDDDIVQTDWRHTFRDEALIIDTNRTKVCIRKLIAMLFAICLLFGHSAT